MYLQENKQNRNARLSLLFFQCYAVPIFGANLSPCGEATRTSTTQCSYEYLFVVHTRLQRNFSVHVCINTILKDATKPSISSSCWYEVSPIKLLACQSLRLVYYVVRIFIFMEKRLTR